MKFDARLLKAYRDSYFFINKDISYPSFAIITAWNPFSEQVSKGDNLLANHQLEHEFLKKNYETLEVGDVSRNWIEESFAVEIGIVESVRLAKKYKQNAIYYVENNELFLVSCVEEDDEVASEKIGCFSPRLRSTGALPKELK